MATYSMSVSRGKYGLVPPRKAWATVWATETGQAPEAVTRVQVSVSGGEVFPLGVGPYVMATDTDGVVYRALDLTWDLTAYHYHADAGIARKGDHADRTTLDAVTARYTAACACGWAATETHILEKKARLQLSGHIDTATQQEAVRV